MFKLKTKYLFGLLAIMYPIFVFCTLVVFKLPVRYLSIGIIIFGIAYSAVNLSQGKKNRKIALFVSPVILVSIGIISICLGDNLTVIQMYPAFADLSYLTIMITSIIVQPPLVYHFVNALDKSLKDSIPKEIFTSFCILASLVWCAFFVIDALIAVIIALKLGLVASINDETLIKIWTIYFGVITYCIMGLIFIGEYVIIKRIKKKHLLLQSLLAQQGETKK